MIRDAHIHSPFCPHGTTDSFESYIEKAISHGLTDITFTEHAPMPKGFIDPTPQKDSGMREEDVLPYIEKIQALQQQYKEHIHIRVGFEIDYIAGFEQQTKEWLNHYGPFIDDSILSVHFLLHDDQYVCIDYSDDVFIDFASKIGGVQNIYTLYYNSIKASILADLGFFKPKRIGHPTLVHKFQLAHNEAIDDRHAVEEVLHMMAQQQLELDVNSAGYAKKFCKEPYPPLTYFKLIKALNIPIIFGSDAHQAQDLLQYSEYLQPYFD
ncbi:histidinol-phosphatase HisJ [Kurthia sibirica]|uniref:Histidinol-phosphatase n=1 Tax=Kurthia sibirica TaxID=202750 RepID=A0A2U3AP51_9BACL|nr:histidinol-phosphatase HisJ [Kurthia sibirica]PWI26225.1 histidinol-phosphatase [Kurthia sibirica]GEK35532.1 histidinol-phosphatase [Kurthia sibirica]